METYSQAMVRNANLKKAAAIRLKANMQGRKLHGVRPKAGPQGLNRKRERKLDMRKADWQRSMDTKNTEASGAQQRKESGGFKRPGSWN